MTVSTHCTPSGSLGTNEIPVCNVGSANVSALIPTGGLGNGNIRGVVVAMHGLSVGPQSIPPSILLGNSTIAGYSTGTGTDFAENLLNDGWIYMGVAYPEDYVPGNGALAIWSDINSDTTNGTRYLSNQIHWWDHVVEYIRTTYGQNIPIVAYGGSWGGYHTLQVAMNRQSTIIAYCSDLPATILANASVAYTAPANYGPTTVAGYAGLPNGTGGLDIPTNALSPGYTTPLGVTNTSGVTIPGCIMYGTNDAAIGWEYTSSSPGVTPINSNTDQILTNAASNSLPCTRIQTTDYHAFLNDDAGYSATYIDTGPTSLSTIAGSTHGRLDVQGLNGGQFSAGILSGKCAIYASDNAWHTITFTNFGFTNYTTTPVSDVTTLSSSTLALGSTSDLNKSSGIISVLTSGNTLYANFTGKSGNNLTGVTWLAGSGSIAASSSGYYGNCVVSLINYCSTPISSVTSLSNSTLTLSSTVGLDPGGGTIEINTSGGPYFNLGATYSGVSGNTITGVTYVSGSGVIYGGTPVPSKAITAVNLSGTTLTLTTASSMSLTVGAYLTISGASGGTWGSAGTYSTGINGTWAITSNSGTTTVVTYSQGGSTPSGTYTASSATATTNISQVNLVSPLTGCSFSGSNSATLSAGAPVELLGIPVPGGYMNMSLTSWFQQVVDPIAPRLY